MSARGKIILGMLVIIAGCAAHESDAERRVVSRAVEHDAASDPQVEVMRPMWGKWKIDPESTMRVNESLPAEMRADIRQDLESHPFELEITDRDYISRSNVKTIWDRYRVLKIDGGWVQLELSNAEGRGQHRGGPKLRVLEGKLLIATGQAMVVMMRDSRG